MSLRKTNWQCLFPGDLRILEDGDLWMIEDYEG